MELKIIIECNRIFGRRDYYAVNDFAKLLVAVSGQKTFTTEQLMLCRDAGVPIEEQNKPTFDMEGGSHG